MPVVAAPVRIGLCSFADDTLIGAWYPKPVRTGEQRLRYYAERYDTVEIDSTYYTLPAAENAARWAERTPSGFVFHIKAFGLMTRHPVRLEQLPPDLRDAVETDARGRVDRPSPEVRAEVFARFCEALEPLRRAEKLGGILLQFPPYVVPRASSFEYLEWAKEQLPGHRLLVEFRHRDWLADDQRGATLAFLERLGATFVCVDAPPTGGKNVLPTVVARTSETAYVRLHGRNVSTWNRRTGSAADRFDHLYSEQELSEWVEPLRELSKTAREAYVMMNTNGRSPDDTVPAQFVLDGEIEHRVDGWIAQAPANAAVLRRLLVAANIPVSEP
jgi:uncharacterized protein YecE (DUF72 family)